MLNGISPLLVFSFPLSFTPVKGLKGIPSLIQDFKASVGIPIPLYLDPGLTGIHVESESKAIDIETTPQVRYDGKAPSVDQRGLNNLITINMFASQTSIALAVLLAFSDMIFKELVTKNYSVTYINGATTVFGGLLHGFSTSTGSDDDLVRIVMQISKANLSPPVKGGTELVNKAITGATPVPVGG